MSLAIQAALKGDLAAWSQRATQAIASARTSVIRRRTAALKKNLRGDVERAQLGKLGRAVQSRVIDRETKANLARGGAGLDPEGAVFSKALVKGRPGGLVDLITVFDQGATITASGAKWIAIRNPAVVRNRKSTPATFGDRLGFVRLGPQLGALYLKAESAIRRGQARGLVVAFWLKPEAHLKKRLRVQRRYEQATRGLAELEARTIDRNLARAQVRTGLA